jgi:hypothetical protein
VAADVLPTFSRFWGLFLGIYSFRHCGCVTLLLAATLAAAAASCTATFDISSVAEANVDCCSSHSYSVFTDYSCFARFIFAAS